MKKLIITIATSITILSLVSCKKADETPKPVVFKFYHGDTNKEVKTSYGRIQAMQQGKLYRLDITTGECYNYTTNNK